MVEGNTAIAGGKDARAIRLEDHLVSLNRNRQRLLSQSSFHLSDTVCFNLLEVLRVNSRDLFRVIEAIS